MIGIKRILCPTNLSSESDEALRYAVALAFASRAKLLLLYCRETGSNDNQDSGDAPIVEPVPLFAESLATHLGLKSISDLNWEGLVAQNVADVGNAIVNEAANRGVDLIVMRSRRRPHSALLLGSTAETVCRTARCTVLVTHPIEREWVEGSTGEIDPQRILVAYDYSTDSEVALDYGLLLANEYQTELHLLHVITEAEQDEPVFVSVQDTEGTYASAASRLRHAVPTEALELCRIVTEVRWGNAHQEVLAYAKEHEIDLISVGASERSLGSLFGSNVDRILRQAPCPVLMARTMRPTDLTAAAHFEDQP